MNLTNNQKKFCQEYLKLGMNATQAYMKVYKTCKKEETARTNASRMLTNANIKKYIEEVKNINVFINEFEQDETLNGLKNIAILFGVYK